MLEALIDQPAPTADEMSKTARRIRTWLLSSRVQMRSGPHAGAVAGAVNREGVPGYVYPEITGYYLHWLAEIGAPATRALAGAANLATQWAALQFANSAVPLTRSYLQKPETDWRNSAVFFFDLAMLLRGLCAAVDSGLIASPPALLRRIVEELDAFVTDDGGILAARVLGHGVELPERWSTQGGPFEVKASSRVMLASVHAEIPERLAHACTQLADRYAPIAATMALDMLHPTLYFAEGLLVAKPHCRPDVARLLERILRLRGNDGSLPESETGSRLPRSDIIAQALRVGVQLHARKIDGAPDERALAALAHALVGRVASDGSVCFRNDVEDPEPNVWCSLFAEQALRWYALMLYGAAVPDAEWLV